jgi:hypothetical protein
MMTNMDSFWRTIHGCCNSGEEPRHFYAALAPGKKFDAASVLAPAQTFSLLYSKLNFKKQIKVNIRVGIFFLLKLF